MYERCETVHVAHAHQRTVDRVEGDIADPRVLEQHCHHASLDVDRHQIAQCEVVVGIESRSTRRIVGKRRHAVQHRAFDVGESLFGTVARIQRANVLDEPRIAKGRIDRPIFFVVVHPRNRTHRSPDQFAVGRYGVLADLGKILALELVLEDDPVLPRLLERDSEHFAEIVGVVARASVVAPKPCDHFLGRMGVSEISGESGAVKVRIRDDLEIDLDAARYEPERIVKMRVVAHHRAEHHLVIAALRSAKSTVHPRLHEYRAALRVPARCSEAGDRQVAVQQ